MKYLKERELKSDFHFYTDSQINEYFSNNTDLDRPFGSIVQLIYDLFHRRIECKDCPFNMENGSCSLDYDGKLEGDLITNPKCSMEGYLSDDNLKRIKVFSIGLKFLTDSCKSRGLCSCRDCTLRDIECHKFYLCSGK